MHPSNSNNNEPNIQALTENKAVQESYFVATNPSLLETIEHWPQILFAGESQTKPSHRLGPKVYDFYLMHIVLSGKGVFIKENVRYELKAGDTFLIRPHELISYVADQSQPWYYRWIAFRGEQAEQLLQLAGFNDTNGVINNAPLEKLSAYYKDIIHIFRDGQPLSNIHALGILLLLMNEYGSFLATYNAEQIQSRTNEGVLQQKILHYLSSQYTQPLSIEHMAEAIGYNRAYLSRIFKRKTGLTPSAFLLQLRLDKARHLLRGRTDLTIEQIAASVGIQDALYFSKQFKKRYKLSPTAFRKSYIEQLK